MLVGRGCRRRRSGRGCSVKSVLLWEKKGVETMHGMAKGMHSYHQVSLSERRRKRNLQLAMEVATHLLTHSLLTHSHYETCFEGSENRALHTYIETLTSVG